MLIAPRISNRVGEQIAHTTIEDFKALKSKATSDEPTEKDESSEDSSANTKPKKNNAQNEYASELRMLTARWSQRDIPMKTA